jgi:hypothetical protein
VASLDRSRLFRKRPHLPQFRTIQVCPKDRVTLPGRLLMLQTACPGGP